MPDNVWQRGRSYRLAPGERPRKMLAKKADVQRETILVVEDDLLISALVRNLLENAGYAVVTADDGEEGLLAYQRYQAKISLLLTDVMMPRMNGIDLADRVLQLDSNLPVLFMSGDAPRANLHFGCLAKPFNSADLVGRVAQVLHPSDRRPDEARLR
jgi:two-component system, cell cycle sensor histidine kinase and response regulator CckA